MLNKKKTLVIDSEAEEKAKAQAIKQELDNLKPKQQPKPQDVSKATNQKALTKIRKRTIKFAIFAVLTLALILGLAWSINQKNKNEQAKVEENEERKAQLVINEQVSKVTSGTLSDDAEERCQSVKYVSEDSYSDCFKKEQSAEIDDLLKKSGQNLSVDELDQLFYLKIYNVTSSISAPETQLEQLAEIEKEVKNSNAGYLTYRDLAIEYVSLDDIKKALEMFKIAKQKFIEARKNDPENNLDAYIFPTTEEELKNLINEPDYHAPEN